ncbi:hypothetical protein ACTMU2_37840 [Cupriavidus basilensis]
MREPKAGAKAPAKSASRAAAKADVAEAAPAKARLKRRPPRLAKQDGGHQDRRKEGACQDGSGQAKTRAAGKATVEAEE